MSPKNNSKTHRKREKENLTNVVSWCVAVFLVFARSDDKTLESYNIAAGATVHMVLQLRGGGRY